MKLSIFSKKHNDRDNKNNSTHNLSAKNQLKKSTWEMSSFDALKVNYIDHHASNK